MLILVQYSKMSFYNICFHFFFNPTTTFKQQEVMHVMNVKKYLEKLASIISILSVNY